MSRKLLVFDDSKNELIIINLTTLATHSQPLKQEEEGIAMEDAEVVGYKNYCICCKRGLFGGVADAQLINLDTNQTTLLSNCRESVFWHSTRKGVVCIARSNTFSLVDMNSCQEIGQLTVNFDIDDHSLYRMYIIGKYLVTVNHIGSLLTYDLIAKPGKKSFNQSMTLDSKGSASVMDFDKKTGELVIVSGSSVLLLIVDNWKENSSQPISFTIVKQLTVERYTRYVFRLNKMTGYDYLLCGSDKITWVNWQRGIVKSIMSKSVRVKELHSQSINHVKVIGYNCEGQSLGIYRLTPTGSMSLEQTLMDNISVAPEVYIQPEPTGFKKTIRTALRNCQQSNKLTDLQVLL